ncbi:NADH dehydrogenase-like protein [Anatilimnocola aggregata]|uniref:NADH dehydrogenase-like protein n=1 Tax=Anatilimnocola aggregata TaxID=2528021 RepID=A0A517YJV2_9BACT|nr:NAD(P)/FAD-dependent oxidoreductase [Anatilimnocola aggregata]QDU30496.1 NADH dehydrogenase-like protein [Anatilimnocola aggregata]
MSPKKILVLGGGFAGLWGAVGAARKLAELGLGPEAVNVTLVNRDPYHSIRVRNYEADLGGIRIPLDDVLEPIGVQRIEGDAGRINVAAQTVLVKGASGSHWLPYDRLVFALGSQLVRPAIPGLAEYSFDVDTYDGAAKLQQHMQALSQLPESPGRYTVVVVGAGLTGIETVAELPARLRKIMAATGTDQHCRVILADHNPHVGSDMGNSALPIIEEALASLGIETMLGVQIAGVGPNGVTLGSGEAVPAATVVWCAGMRANPLTQQFGVELNRFGQLAVDEFLRVKNVPHVFAAGDSATAMMDEQHASVMSCQHGRPMGRFAGHNVVSDLFAQPMLPLHIDWYVTVLDLGSWGAVYTEGWDRHMVAQGADAKQTKQIINCQRIYPPLNRNRDEILAAAAPVVQRPPQYQH